LYRNLCARVAQRKTTASEYYLTNKYKFSGIGRMPIIMSAFLSPQSN